MNGHATEKETSDTYLLLVDDDTFSRKLALEILRRPGICVEVAITVPRRLNSLDMPTTLPC